MRLRLLDFQNVRSVEAQGAQVVQGQKAAPKKQSWHHQVPSAGLVHIVVNEEGVPQMCSSLNEEGDRSCLSSETGHFALHEKRARPRD